MLSLFPLRLVRLMEISHFYVIHSDARGEASDMISVTGGGSLLPVNKKITTDLLLLKRGLSQH